MIIFILYNAHGALKDIKLALIAIYEVQSNFIV